MGRVARKGFVLPLLVALALPVFAQRGGGAGSSGGGPHIVATEPSGGCQSLDVLMFTDGDGIHFFYCPGGNGEWTEQTYEGLRADAIAPVGDCNTATVVYGILDGSFSKCLNGSWLNTLGIYATDGRTYLGRPDIYTDSEGMTIGSDPGDGRRSLWMQANTNTVDEPPVGYVAIGAVQTGAAGTEKLNFRINGGTTKEFVDKASLQVLENKTLNAPTGAPLNICFDDTHCVTATVDASGNMNWDQVNGTSMTFSDPVLFLTGLSTDNYIHDVADATKKASIDLSGSTAAKTATLVFAHTADRTYTFPNSSGTIALTSGVPADLSAVSFITKVAETGLSNEFALGSLATGLLKNTTTTGVPSIAVANTDYTTPAGVTSLVGIASGHCGSVSVDPPSTLTLAVSTVAVTATGVIANDTCVCNAVTDFNAGIVQKACFGSGTDQMTVRFLNITIGTIDAGAQTMYYCCFH